MTAEEVKKCSECGKPIITKAHVVCHCSMASNGKEAVMAKYQTDDRKEAVSLACDMSRKCTNYQESYAIHTRAEVIGYPRNARKIYEMAGGWPWEFHMMDESCERGNIISVDGKTIISDVVAGIADVIINSVNAQIETGEGA